VAQRSRFERVSPLALVFCALNVSPVRASVFGVRVFSACARLKREGLATARSNAMHRSESAAKSFLIIENFLRTVGLKLGTRERILKAVVPPRCLPER
jgi:hypothetical protein